MKKNVTIRYFALVGARRGTQTEPYATAAATARQLLHEIQQSGQIPLTTNIVKAAINDEFVKIAGTKIAAGCYMTNEPLPGDLPADRVVLKGHLLYAASGRQVFKRTMKIGAPDIGMPPVAPTTPGYGDGYEYSIPHLPQ